MRRVLQTNVSCICKCIEHMAIAMRKKIVKDIVENNRKICILVNVSTTLSNMSMLVICLRCAVGELDEIYTFYLTLLKYPTLVL